VGKSMNQRIEIDEVDCKILRALIKDARTQLKIIAKECGISSVSTLNRIKRMKTLGVIKGATLFPNIAEFRLPIVATIGINLKENQADVIKVIDENTNLVQISASIGKYDLIALVYAESIAELDKIAFSMRRLLGVIKVEVNVWASLPLMVFENIDLQPKEVGDNG
jgi:Lrp/AsnC family transcriptional regulator for asnA, asnC and gidA